MEMIKTLYLLHDDLQKVKVLKEHSIPINRWKVLSLPAKGKIKWIFFGLREGVAGSAEGTWKG